MITFLLTITSTLFAPGNSVLNIMRPKAINPVSDMWKAVKMVESTNTPDTINHLEGAYGCGQIRQGKLDDYNRVTGSNIGLTDCLNEAVSFRVFVWHCFQYSDLKTAVKRWNGSGPATEIYWNKIKRYL